MLETAKKILITLIDSRFSFLTKHFFYSSGYKLIDREKFFSQKLIENSWSEQASKKQDKAWSKILNKNNKRSDLLALKKSLDYTGSRSENLCEIGCASGYLAKFIKDNSLSLIKYYGVDLSIEPLLLAKTNEPFIQARSFQLPFEKEKFDIVLDGATLIHVHNWRESIHEYARVTKKFVILHSLTLSESQDNTYLNKFAYGQKVSEIIFSRNKILQVCNNSGLRLTKVYRGEIYSAGQKLDSDISSETWVLEKFDE